MGSTKEWGQTVFSQEQAPTMPRSGRSKPGSYIVGILCDFSCWYEWQPSLPSKMIKTTWGSQRESNGHSHRIANAALRNSRLANPILQGKLVTYIPCMWPSFCLSLPLSSSLLYIVECCCCCCQCFCCCSLYCGCCCCCCWWWSQPPKCLTLLGRVHLCQPRAFVTVIEKLSCITHGWGATHESMVSFRHFTPQKLYIYMIR